MPIYWFLAVFTSAILFRLLLICIHKNWFKQGFVGDSSVHWLLVKNIKSNRRLKFISQYLIGSEPTSYPRAFHHYAALFKLDWLRSRPWLPNLVLFSLATGLYSVYALYYFTHLQTAPIQSVIWAVLLFFLAVSNLTFDGPAIAYLKLSERLYARLFCSIYFLSMAVAMDFSDTPSFVIAIIAGAISGTASKFGRQVMVFLTPALSLLAMSWTPILILLFSIVGSLLLSGKHFLRSVKYQIKHLCVYATKLKHDPSRRAALSNYLNLKQLSKHTSCPRKLIGYLLSHEPVRSLTRYPELSFLIVYWSSVSFPPSSASFVIIASIVFFCLTSARAFNHFGEAYRYVEYSLVFLLPLSLAELAADNQLFGTMATVLLAMSVFLAIGLGWGFRRKNLPETDHLKQFVDPLGFTKDDVVFPVSMRLGADICARAPCQSFWWQPGNVTDDIYDKFIEEYPYLKRDWLPLADEFGATHIVVDKDAAKRIAWKYDFSSEEIIAENPRYVAYKVASAS